MYLYNISCSVCMCFVTKSYLCCHRPEWLSAREFQRTLVVFDGRHNFSTVLRSKFQDRVQFQFSPSQASGEHSGPSNQIGLKRAARLVNYNYECSDQDTRQVTLTISVLIRRSLS